MELHPLCTFFPRMSDEEFNLLKESLQQNGQTHPIFTLDGMILDGGNRYRALCELGIEPKITEYQGQSPTQFILSSNLHRRHLTPGQSAAIVSASQSWINAQPDASNVLSHVQMDTTAARAKQSGVGQKTQQLADKLIKEAPEALVQEVINGTKSLNKAIKEITPPKPAKPKSSVDVDDFEDEGSLEYLSSDEDQDAVLNTSASAHYAAPKVNAHQDGSADSLSDIKKLTALNRALNLRINELTQQKEEAIKSANYWKEKFLALEATLNQDMAD